MDRVGLGSAVPEVSIVFHFAVPAVSEKCASHASRVVLAAVLSGPRRGDPSLSVPKRMEAGGQTSRVTLAVSPVPCQLFSTSETCRFEEIGPNVLDFVP